MKMTMKKNRLLGDKWPATECTFDWYAEGGVTLNYRTTDGSKSGTLENCTFVDVPNRSGKRQHRFDVTNVGDELVELAALNDTHKDTVKAAFSAVQDLKMGRHRFNVVTRDTLVAELAASSKEEKELWINAFGEGA